MADSLTGRKYTTMTIAGSGGKGCSDGSLLDAAFNAPSAIIQLSTDVFLISDTAGNALRLLDLKSKTVSTLDVTGPHGSGFSVLAPRGLCKASISGIEGVLLADSGHHRLGFLNGETGHIEVLAGTGEAGHLDGELLRAMFNAPSAAIYNPVNCRITKERSCHVRGSPRRINDSYIPCLASESLPRRNVSLSRFLFFD